MNDKDIIDIDFDAHELRAVPLADALGKVEILDRSPDCQGAALRQNDVVVLTAADGRNQSDDELARQREIDAGVAFICNERPEDATISLNDVHVTDLGRPVRPHRSGGQRIASTQSIAIAVLLSTAGGIQSLRTGRDISRYNSERMEEDRLRLRVAISKGRAAGVVTVFDAPRGKVHLNPTSPESLARIAAAEAKRARKAAKKGSK